jgi:thymidylate synthase
LGSADDACRTPRPFPKLRFRREVADVDDFSFDDFMLEGYDPHPPIKMDMAV